MEEIIYTNQELRKQLAEDDIIIAEYKTKIRLLERDLEHCNQEINLLNTTILNSEEEIECLRKDNTNLSKQLRKALLEVERKEKSLVHQDNQIKQLEERILTLKSRIKDITLKKMSVPAISEHESLYEDIQSELDIIKNHLYPLPGSSPSNLTQQAIIDKFIKITEKTFRLNEIIKCYKNWYNVEHNTNIALTAEKNNAQEVINNAQRHVNALQTQLSATNTLLEQKERRLEQTNHDIRIERAKHAKWKDRTKTERAKHAKWKNRTRTSHAKHGKWKQRFRLLQQLQINQQPNMGDLRLQALQAINTELAKIPNYVGQETPSDYLKKIDQIISALYNVTTDGVPMANDRANAFLTDDFKLDVYKSKMGGKFSPIPTHYPAGTALNTIANFMTWLNDRFRLETFGTRQTALIGLMQEEYTSADNPDSFERKMRPYLIGQTNETVIPILLNKLPEILEMRVRQTFDRRAVNEQTPDNFFIDLKNAWMQRRPGRDLTNVSIPQAIAQPVIQQPLAPIQQPVYHKSDPKAFVEETYNTTRDIIKQGQEIKGFGGNKLNIES